MPTSVGVFIYYYWIHDQRAASNQKKEPELYEKLGGEAAIDATYVVF